MNGKVPISDFVVGNGDLVMIAGPCVIETADATLHIARTLQGYAGELGLPLIFKASYDKANRTSVTSFRGPGLAKGLEILARVKDEVGLPVIADVHQVADVAVTAGATFGDLAFVRGALEVRGGVRRFVGGLGIAAVAIHASQTSLCVGTRAVQRLLFFVALEGPQGSPGPA